MYLKTWKLVTFILCIAILICDLSMEVSDIEYGDVRLIHEIYPSQKKYIMQFFDDSCIRRWEYMLIIKKYYEEKPSSTHFKWMEIKELRELGKTLGSNYAN